MPALPLAVLTSLTLLALALPAAALAAETKTINGTIAKSACRYSITAEESSAGIEEGKLTQAKLQCGSAFSISLVASWNGSEVTLEEISGSLLGHTLGPKKVEETVDLNEAPTALATLVEEAAPKLLEKAQAQLLQSPLKLKGEIASSGCTYDVEATWTGEDLSSGEVTGEVGCSSLLSVELAASWSEESASIEKLVVDLNGNKEEIASGGSFTLPASGALDIPDLIESLVPQIAGQATQTIANAGAGLLNGAPGNAITQFLDGQPEATPEEILAALDTTCEKGTRENRECGTGKEEESTKPPYAAMLDEVAAEHKPAGGCPLPGVEAAEEVDNIAVVCIPVVLGGTFDAGSKDVVLVPGGAILALGSESGTGEAEIKTSGSVLFMAGAVGGAGLRIDAGGSVEFAASYAALLGSLQVHASGAFKVGEVEAGRLLEGLLGIGGTKGGTVTAGADVLAGHVAIQAGETSIAAGSAVSSDGSGGPGGLCIEQCNSGPWGIAPGSANQPGGASLLWGGSHAGFGSYGFEDPITHTGWELLDPAAPATVGEEPGQPPGRGRTFDDAFDPKDPGSGGGGSEGNDGWSGGGIIEIASTSLQLNGSLSADGSGTFVLGDPNGGSGGGGSINLATGALSGNGKVEANGGGLCETCGNGLTGGDGGGGMISERYTSSSFGGTSQAIGGENLITNNATYDLRANGGAGTVYELQTEKAPSAPKYGSSSKKEEEGEEEIPELEDLARAAAGRRDAAAPSAEGAATAAARAPAGAAPGDCRLARGRQPRACAARAAAPRLARLTLSPTSFVPDSSGVGATAASAGATTGTTVSYSDSAAATAVFDVDRPQPGLHEHRRCVRASSVPARKRRGLRSCTFVSVLGSFSHHDRRGANRLHFTGRLSHGALPTGTYRLKATPHSGRHTGASITTTFRIIAPSPPPPAPKEPPKAKTVSAGTLIIDDDHSAVEPPNDGTPLPENAQTKNMTLEIKGGARVYASHGEWARIVISGDSRLTVTPPATLPAPPLDVKAGEIEVQAGSSIEANSLGYAGAGLDEESGHTAPGATPSTFAAGGSHGGRGAVNSELAGKSKSESGSPFDDPEDPTLPGGGGGGGYAISARASSGGGVVDVTAGTLVLDGTIEANGENGWGPTYEEPFWFERGAATGAGGSVQIHVQTLDGDGAIEANGGTACVHSADNPDQALPDENPDPALPDPCEAGGPGEEENTGGGGLILVQAPSHAGFTGQITANGGANGSADGSAGIVTGP